MEIKGLNKEEGLIGLILVTTSKEITIGRELLEDAHDKILLIKGVLSMERVMEVVAKCSLAICLTKQTGGILRTL